MNDEMTELLKLMRRSHGNELIKEVVATLAEIVSEQQGRIEFLEALVPPARLIQSKDPFGVRIVPL